MSLVIRGDAFAPFVQNLVAKNYPDGFDLSICDPPYGEIVDEEWDVADYFRWMSLCDFHSKPNATIAMWGGVGKPGHRPFFEFAATVEKNFPGWEYEYVTWKKKRGYGVRDRYLFTREELLILKRGEPVFNVPYLDEKRGYAGYSKDYPAKSEFLRRSNVWADVTEILRGKIHPTQKPDRLYEILVEAHAPLGGLVFDPCAGSLPTKRACEKLGRQYCCVEKKLEYIQAANVLRT